MKIDYLGQVDNYRQRVDRLVLAVLGLLIVALALIGIWPGYSLFHGTLLVGMILGSLFTIAIQAIWLMLREEGNE